MDGERVHVTDQSNLERSLLVTSRGCTPGRHAWGLFSWGQAASVAEPLAPLEDLSSLSSSSSSSSVVHVCCTGCQGGKHLVQERGLYGRLPVHLLSSGHHERAGCQWNGSVDMQPLAAVPA